MCYYRTADGMCKKHSDNVFTAYCVEGPCPDDAPTNADRIRGMSDEELAEFIFLSPEMEFDVCRYCTSGNPTPTDDRGQCLRDGGRCYANDACDAFKNWLQQPAKEEA